VRNDSSALAGPQTGDRDDDTTGPPQTAQVDDTRQEKAPANREARYRTERNEARQQVTQLTERIGRMQRAEVERMAAQLHDPADLWTTGVDLAELLNEDGQVDPERVAVAVAVLADSRPYLLKPPPRVPSFGQGRRPLVDSGSGTSWGSLLCGQAGDAVGLSQRA
jgi:hypothetical protein